MRFAAFFIFALLVLPGLVVAADVSPHKYGSLLIDGSITNPVLIVAESPKASISSLDVNISWMPFERQGQEITFFETFPEAVVTERMAFFSLVRPALGQHSFDIEYQVRTTADAVPVTKKVRFPLSPLPGELAAYLLPTETIDINEDISNLAASIAGDEDDLFLVVSAIALWTNEQITYDLSTVNVEASQPSSWVLENREGVCDEMTNLFISMLRSLGIPARFVSGLAYTNSELFKERWGAHGWAEVYFPGQGWVPFDVTYDQLGWVDASHIVFATDVDSGKYATSYSWIGRDVEVEPSGMGFDADIVREYGALDPLLALSVEALEEPLGFGSYQLVMATVSNPSSQYVAEEFQLSFVDGFTMLDDAFQSVVLPPGGEQVLYWRLVIDKDLDKRYYYEFPLIVTGVRGASGKDSFTVRPGEQTLSLSWVDRFVQQLEEGPSSAYAGEVSFSCSLMTGSVPRPGEAFSVECSLVNEGEMSLRGVMLCFMDSCKEVDVVAGGSVAASFPATFDAPSLYALSFTARHSMFEKYAYVSVEVAEQPLLVIRNLSAPRSIDYSSSGKISFDVSHVAGVPARAVTVALVGPRQEKSWSFDEFSGTTSFSITVDGSALSLDDDGFSILVSYQDDRGVVLRAQESFVVALGDATWWQRLLLRLNSWLG